MALQGSVHRWSDGIGYGAFIPTDAAYYNLQTVKTVRPNEEMVREYRRHNCTAGIETHRSDISFGRTEENVKLGAEGNSRAILSTKSLTSGEVGDFSWPGEARREGDLSTILASTTLDSVGQQSRGGNPNSESPSARSSARLSARSTARSHTGSSEPAASSRRLDPSRGAPMKRCSTGSTSSSRHLQGHHALGAKSGPGFADIAFRRGPSFFRKWQERTRGEGGKDSQRLLPKYMPLDPVFDPHRKFDLLAATSTGPITNRYGPVDSASVLSASHLTSELSTPWSHVLRGQKY
ncbi:unnamed protein product [Discosporangium mesarthrocarpum]